MNPTMRIRPLLRSHENGEIPFSVNLFAVLLVRIGVVSVRKNVMKVHFSSALGGVLREEGKKREERIPA